MFKISNAQFSNSHSRPQSWVALERPRYGPQATATCSSHRFIDAPDLRSATPSNTISAGFSDDENVKYGLGP